jgi:hypothetical protein
LGEKVIDYSPVINQVVFRGTNPLSGMEVEVIFAEKDQVNKRLLMWNKLLHHWVYSKDAGLTWYKVEIHKHNTIYDVLTKTDLVLKWDKE